MTLTAPPNPRAKRLTRKVNSSRQRLILALLSLALIGCASPASATRSPIEDIRAMSVTYPWQR